MTGMEKFAALVVEGMSAQGANLSDMEKQALVGRFLGAAVRGVGKAFAAPFVGAARGAGFLGRQARGLGAGFMTAVRGGTQQQAQIAGRLAAMPKAAPSTTPVPTMARKKQVALSVSGKTPAPVPSAPVPSAPSGGRKPLSEVAPLAERMGTQPPPPTPGPGPGSSRLALPLLGAGGSGLIPRKRPDAPGGYQYSPGGILTPTAEMLEVLEKISSEIQDPEERLAAIAETFMQLGFDSEIAAIAKEAGWAPEAVQEKTAADEKKDEEDEDEKKEEAKEKAEEKKEDKDEKKDKKASERPLRFTNLTTNDIIQHLSDQWGRVEQGEKVASERPGFAKFAKFLEKELSGRPS